MTDLEKVRAACVEAVPEIREEYPRCMGCGYGFDYCKKIPKVCPIKYSDRPITLADVLLAIKTAPARKAYGHLTALERTWFQTITHWNLRKDSLDEQSPECLSFLAGTITNNA